MRLRPMRIMLWSGIVCVLCGGGLTLAFRLTRWEPLPVEFSFVVLMGGLAWGITAIVGLAVWREEG